MGARSVVAVSAAAATAASLAPLHHHSAAAVAGVSVSFVVTPARRPPPPTLPSVRPMSSTSSNDGGGAKSIKQRKALLRKEIAAKLKALEDGYIREQSRPLFARLLALPAVAASRCLSVYLSMPTKEVPTYPNLLNDVCKGGREVYVPKVTGPASPDMVMLRIPGPDAVAAFPKSKWGIPEPSVPEPFDKVKDDGTYTGRMDLVIVPGVAFDAQCRRLGHGKGYYDCFLARLAESNAAKGGPRPYTVGLALEEQIIPEVPTDTFDLPLDAVVTPTIVYFREK